MKLVVFSDCHFEFHKDKGASFVRNMARFADCVAVVAGDLSTLPLLLPSLQLLCNRYDNVVYVAGNHDLYGASPSDLQRCKARALKSFKNFHWLDNSSVEIGGVRFVGTTLWFPPPPLTALKWALNDYSQIRDFEPWVYHEHGKALSFLENELDPDDVLITHHFPFSKSIAKEYDGSSLNPFFHAGSRAEELVAKKEPRLAVHGHTHTSFDYESGKTRVVCNPAGYLSENSLFDFEKVVEL